MKNGKGQEMDRQTQIKARRLLSMVRPEILASHTSPAIVGYVNWSGSAIQVAESWISETVKHDKGATAIGLCGDIKRAALEVLPEDE